MTTAIVVAAVALASALAILIACIRSPENPFGLVGAPTVLLISYVTLSTPVVGATDSLDGITFVSASVLALSSALFLGSLFKPVRPVIYLFCMLGAQIIPEDTRDHEEHLALRKSTRWYCLAAAGLFPVFYFTYQPLLVQLIGRA